MAWEPITAVKKPTTNWQPITQPIDFSKIKVAPPPTAAPSGIHTSTPAMIAPNQGYTPLDAIAEVGAAAETAVGQLGPAGILSRSLPPQASQNFPKTFSGQATAATASLPKPIAGPVGMVAGMIGDPTNVAGPGEIKIAGKVAKEAPNFFRLFNDAQKAFFQRSVTSIDSGKLLTIKDWEMFKNLLNKNGFEVPSTQNKAAKMMSVVMDPANEVKAFDESLNASYAAQQPDPAVIAAAANKQPRIPKGQPEAGRFDFVQKLKDWTGYDKKTSQRGMFSNPFAPEPNPLGNTAPQQPKQAPPVPPQEPLSHKQIPSLLNDITAIKTNPELNTDNFNISAGSRKLIDQTIEDIRPQIDQRIGTQLSNSKVLDLANNTSKILSNTIGKAQTENWSAAMHKLRQEVALAADSGTVDQHFVDNLLVLKTQGTDIARKLQSLSIGADPKETTAAQAIISAVLDQNKNVDDIVEASKGVNFNNAQEAAKFYRKFVKPQAGEWLDLLRYNSMLSSPKTHIVNAASNAINSALIAPVEQAVTGGVDFLGSKITGNERKYFAGESGAYLKGYFSNAKDAFKAFAGVLSGERASTNLDIKNIALAPEGGIKGAIEETLSLPMQMLEGMDQFFTTLTAAGEDARLAYRASKGVDVTETQKALQPMKDASYRLYRQDLFPEGQGTLLNAIDELTSIVYSARNNKNPLISYPAKFSIPFIKTPMNIFKQGIEYSPTGFLTTVGAAEKSPQIAKALIGSSVFAAGGMLLASNRLTWAEPSNETEKNAFKAAGLQSYSVKIGDNWVSYQKLPPPLAFPLSMIALIHQAQKDRKLDESTGEMILSAISKYGNFLADQSYAKSFGDLLSAVSGEESSIAKLASNYPTQLVPFRAFGGWLARLSDHVQRKPDPDGTFIEKEVQLLMMNIPGLSDNVPARTDAKGAEIQQPSPVLNAFTPFNMSTERKDKAAEFNDVVDLRKRLSDQVAGRTVMADQAEREFIKLSHMDQEEAAARFDELAQSNPTLAKKIVTLFNEDRKGLAPQDKLVLQLGVENGERARYLAEEINSAPEDERQYLWEDYVKKKLITADVAKQLTPLLNQ